MTAAPPGSLLTAASFRTWRGSETQAAQVPTFNTVSRGQAKDLTSAREFGPAKADCRCRGPPAPHLARPTSVYPAPELGPAARERSTAPTQRDQHQFTRPQSSARRLEKEAPRPLSATNISLPGPRAQPGSSRKKHRAHIARPRISATPPQMRPPPVASSRPTPDARTSPRWRSGWRPLLRRRRWRRPGSRTETGRSRRRGR